MNTEQLGELSKALSKAQGKKDRFSESKIIKNMYEFPSFKKNFVTGDHRKKPLIMRFFEMVAFGSNECWYWIASINKHGYGKMGRKLAHRVCWQIHYGEIPKGLNILHKCDVPSCVNPDHLFLGTHDDNMKDMADKNRAKNRINGELNLQHKLTEKEVLEIRDLYPTIRSYKKLSLKFNVSISAIERIIRRKNWRHI